MTSLAETMRARDLAKEVKANDGELYITVTIDGEEYVVIVAEKKMRKLSEWIEKLAPSTLLSSGRCNYCGK